MASSIACFSVDTGNPYADDGYTGTKEEKEQIKKNIKLANHENPTTLDSASLCPEFARLSGSGQIFRMPKIENSFAKKDTLHFTSLHPEFSIFVHKLIKFCIRHVKNHPSMAACFY